MSAHEFVPGDGPLYAALETSMGRVVLRLYEDGAPLTVANFVGLATGRKAWRDPVSGAMREGVPLYDGSRVHRVVPNFLVQLGDPLSRDDGAPDRMGSGGPGYRIPLELSRDRHFDRPGLVATVNDERPDANGSQFFIAETAAPHLHGRHTIFGEVVQGFERVPKISRVKADAQGRPLEPVRLDRVLVSRGSY